MSVCSFRLRQCIFSIALFVFTLSQFKNTVMSVWVYSFQKFCCMFQYFFMNWHCWRVTFFFFLVAVDCLCWAAEVQCQFSTRVPANQRNDFPNFCLHSGHSDCPPSHDSPRHHCLHSGLYANWLGAHSGKLIFLLSPILLFSICSMLKLTWNMGCMYECQTWNMGICMSVKLEICVF